MPKKQITASFVKNIRQELHQIDQAAIGLGIERARLKIQKHCNSMWIKEVRGIQAKRLNHISDHMRSLEELGVSK